MIVTVHLVGQISAAIVYNGVTQAQYSAIRLCIDIDLSFDIKPVDPYNTILLIDMVAREY